MTAAAAVVFNYQTGWVSGGCEGVGISWTHTNMALTLYIAPSLSLFKLFNQTQISSDRRGNKLAALYWPQGTRFEAGRAKNGGTDGEETRPRYTTTLYRHTYIYIYTPVAYGVKTTCIYALVFLFFFLCRKRLVKRLAETTTFRVINTRR